MYEYLNALKYIMENGVDREDRTGVGTRSVFAYQMRFNLQDGFPAVTTKKLAWLGVKSELLWFLEGSTDERRLAEIRYNKPREELTDKETIWTANAQAEYWTSNKDDYYDCKPEFDGDLGRIYGVQWRSWESPFAHNQCDSYHVGETYEGPLNQVDQLADVIQRIKDKPWDRRHIVTAWNPGEIDQMALPPCHMIFQFYVADGKLSCHMNQRSCDMFLGVPFNIASYALLTHMVAQVCDLDVGELILTLGDAHIYFNHFDQVKEQLTRTPFPLPKLELDTNIKNIDYFTMDSIQLIGYESHENIKAKMAV